MSSKKITIAALLFALTGCVVTPRIEIAEHLDFSAPPPNQIPMSYEDLLCCYDCNA